MTLRFGLLLAATPLALVACSGDDTNPPLADAGPAAVDAARDGSLADARTDGTVSPPVDGGAGDAAPVDAGPPVTVHVVDVTGAAEPGVLLVFSDASGAFLGTTATDASGAASLAVPAGGQVTVLFGVIGSPALLTILAVEPGEQLTAIDTTSAASNFIEPVTVTDLPASPPDGGASFLVNAGTCGAQGGGAPLSFELYASPPPCVVAGAFPLLVVDQRADGSPLAYAFQKGNSLDAGAAADGGALAISMAGATWATPSEESLLVSNLPPASASFTGPQLIFTEVAAGVPSNASDLTAAADDAGVYGATFSVHPGYADSVQTEANVQHGSPAGTAAGVAVVAAIAVRSAAAPTAPIAFDMSGVPPFVQSATVDTSIPARPALRWTSAAPLNASDGVIAILNWGGGASWTFVAAPDQASVQAPVFPASLAAWPPPATATFDPPVLMVMKASFWSGYSDFKKGAATIVASSLVGVNGCLGTNGACLPPLSADGTMWLSGLTSSQ